LGSTKRATQLLLPTEESRASAEWLSLTAPAPHVRDSIPSQWRSVARGIDLRSQLRATVLRLWHSRPCPFGEPMAVPGDPHPLTRVAHELNGALSVTDRHLSWCSRAPAVRAPRFELIGKVRVHGGNSCRWEPDRGSASRSPLFQTRHGCGLDTATATLLSKVDVAVLPQEPHAPTSGLRPYEE